MNASPLIHQKSVIRSLMWLCLFWFHLYAGGQPVVDIIVDADHPVFEIQATMWGLFFEDINFAADGGLYAELVKNRSFEFPDPKEGWSVEGASFMRSPLQIIHRGSEHPVNPRTARITVNGHTCITNRGFRGMGIHKDESYRLSMQATVISGDIRIRAKLAGENGEEMGTGVLHPDGEAWRSYEILLRSDQTNAKAGLQLCFEGEGILEIDMVSLFPVHTWKERKNGLRADLIQILADLNPGFLRFPGGCIVEGRDLSKRYQWKNTVGPVGERKTLINRWADENSRATPDYYQSFGLGFYEFFQLAEDLGAEPVPILNCGMACQFNTAEVAAMEEMEPYIQDALDLIEFANGEADSEWGSLRAEMGHPDPFHMNYLGIGNEQWGPRYFERYALFEKALNETHPEIMLISGTGPMASGPLFEGNAEALKQFSPALVDEHFYNPPQWFFNQATRYDAYDRNTYKIFAGEYAANDVGMASPENRNLWETALAEAAFMTGIERNADVVHMASYAPLLAHTEAWQWTPDLIWFDNLDAYGTPNYYVQKLFSTHSGTHTLTLLREGDTLTGRDGLYGSAVRDEHNGEIYVKIVSNYNESRSVRIAFDTDGAIDTEAMKIVLASDDLSAMNSISDPEHISPKEEQIRITGKTCLLDLDPYSLTILKIKLN